MRFGTSTPHAVALLCFLCFSHCLELTIGFSAALRGRSESVTDYKYNRQIALDRCQELMNLARRIGEAIKFGPEEGPLVDDTCERLGKVLSDLNANSPSAVARR